MGNTYVILGGGCSSAIQAALYLLEQPDTNRVIGIGRGMLRSEPFTLNIQQNGNYSYYALHITYEFDLLMELLDKVKPNIIINYAAQGETSVSWKNSWRFFETNCLAMSKLYEELTKRDWLDRFVHVSTAGVYGFADYAVAENHLLDPSSPYGVSKAAFDMYIKSIQKFNKLPIIIVRPATLYCAGQLLHKVIPRAVMAGLSGKRLPLHGGGKIDKSYLHARDFAQAIYLLVKHPSPAKLYNVGPESPRPLYETIELIANELKIEFSNLCHVTEDRLLQDGGYWLDSSAMYADTGWSPNVSMQQGVKEVITWAKKYYSQLLNEPTTYVLRG